MEDLLYQFEFFVLIQQQSHSDISQHLLNGFSNDVSLNNAVRFSFNFIKSKELETG